MSFVYATINPFTRIMLRNSICYLNQNCFFVKIIASSLMFNISGLVRPMSLLLIAHFQIRAAAMYPGDPKRPNPI